LSFWHSIGYWCFHIWKSNFYILCCLRMIRIPLVFRIICFCSKTLLSPCRTQNCKSPHPYFIATGWICFKDWKLIIFNS
jgi:hypothetical protein